MVSFTMAKRCWHLYVESILDKYEILLLTKAVRDLDGIYSHISEALLEPGVAATLIDILEKSILSLEELPYRCTERQNGAYAGKGYRQMLVKNYTVIYRINETEKKVFIASIRYSGSNF